VPAQPLRQCRSFSSQPKRCASTSPVSTITTLETIAKEDDELTVRPLWRGAAINTRHKWSTTGGLEWQTSVYSFNKQATKTLPVALMNAEKLIRGFVTMKQIDNKGKDARVVRKLLNARRKSDSKLFVSKPRVKDFGAYAKMTAFVWDSTTLMSMSRRGRLPPNAFKAMSQSSQPALEPHMQERLQRLISRMYGKPVHLSLVELAQPHLDAEILGAFVAQRLKDRRSVTRGVIRDATWKVPMPGADAVNTLQLRKAALAEAHSRPLAWQSLTLDTASRTTAPAITESLALSQITSARVEAAGRLTKRLTANRSQRKSARFGANAKGPAYVMRGFRKASVQYSFTSSKRRVGQFGVHVSLGHS